MQTWQPNSDQDVAHKHNGMDYRSNWINLEYMCSIFLSSSILLRTDTGILCDFLLLLYTHQNLQVDLIVCD